MPEENNPQASLSLTITETLYLLKALNELELVQGTPLEEDLRSVKPRIQKVFNALNDERLAKKEREEKDKQAAHEKEVKALIRTVYYDHFGFVWSYDEVALQYYMKLFAAVKTAGL